MEKSSAPQGAGAQLLHVGAVDVAGASGDIQGDGHGAWTSDPSGFFSWQRSFEVVKNQEKQHEKQNMYGFVWSKWI